MLADLINPIFFNVIVPAETSKLVFDLSKMSSTILDKWEQVGQELGLTTEKLSTIGREYKNSRQCFFAMMNSWLSRKGLREDIPVYRPLTLRVLAHALESKEVDEGRLAAEISKRKGKCQLFCIFRMVHTIAFNSY